MHLYDYIIYNLINEREFAEGLDKREEVTVYVRLPGGFYINTPVGKYNTDWAVAYYEGRLSIFTSLQRQRGIYPPCSLGRWRN